MFFFFFGVYIFEDKDAVYELAMKITKDLLDVIYDR